MTEDIRSRIREDGLYVGVDGSVKDPRAACPKMERILAKKQEKLARKSESKPEKAGGRAVQMKSDDYEKERYSVCLVNAIEGGSRTYFKYYRVADFDPEEDANELAPAIVQAHVTTLEEAQANPDHLYNPSAAANYESRESDFYLLQWRLDPYDPGRQLTRSFHDDTSLLGFKEAREVIIPPDVSGEADLRNALSNGIPFTGKTTSVFYLVYEHRGDTWTALKCRRRDFLFSDGMIKLPVDFANARGTILSAPRVVLKGYDIIESPHQATSYRRVYARLDELESDGSVLLRPLSYYAADYVKWFIRDESIQVTKSNRSAINQVIESALTRPDALEEYLGADAPEEEVKDLRAAICDIAGDEDDHAKAVIREALLADEGFRQECVDQVMAESTKLLEARRREIAEAEKAIDDARASLEELESGLSSRREEKDALEDEMASLGKELDTLKSSEKIAIEEIQSNIALKLGLGAVASSYRNVVPSGAHVFVEEGRPLGDIEAASDFVSAFTNNLRQAGITSIAGKPSDERADCARGVLGALAATKYLAIPADISKQFSDALCACIAGRSAKRIIVPADCRDFGGILENIHDEDGVVMLENVIDAVNEGVLFAVLAADVKPVTIFSFGSHASAQLLAKESWSRVFLPRVETLAVYPPAAKFSKFQQAEGGLAVPKVSLDEALESADDLYAYLDTLRMQGATLLLAGTVMRAMEEIVDEDPVEPFVSQHLLIASAADGPAFQIIDEWAENDDGLAELACKLGIDEL